VVGNVFIEYFKDRGRMNEKEETARRMLGMGLDPLDIIKATGIDPERLRELREGVRGDEVLA